MKEITYKFRSVSIVLPFNTRRMLSHKICRLIYYILILNFTILAAIHQYCVPSKIKENRGQISQGIHFHITPFSKCNLCKITCFFYHTYILEPQMVPASPPPGHLPRLPYYYYWKDIRKSTKIG